MQPIRRDHILIEKKSGNYECPHFVPPSVALEIATSIGVTLDADASKCLAEISENFAAEVLSICDSSAPSRDQLRDAVLQAKLV